MLFKRWGSELAGGLQEAGGGGGDSTLTQTPARARQDPVFAFSKPGLWPLHMLFPLPGMPVPTPPHLVTFYSFPEGCLTSRRR